MAGEYRWHLIPAVLERRKAEMVQRLGGRCAICANSKGPFDFHHKQRKDWQSRDVSRFERLRRYEEDIKAGKCELLCHSCHSKVTNCEEEPWE